METERDALRQRAETAELFRATLERPHGLRSGQCCDPVIDGEICALLRRVETAEAEAERLRGVDLANRALCEWQKETQGELANLRASQAADLNRIEESYNRLIRELEEGKRKAEAERDEAKRDTAPEAAKGDTARLFWLETSGAWAWAEWYINRGIQPDGLGLRAAIDAAMAEPEKKASS